MVLFNLVLGVRVVRGKGGLIDIHHETSPRGGEIDVGLPYVYAYRYLAAGALVTCQR